MAAAEAGEGRGVGAVAAVEPVAIRAAGQPVVSRAAPQPVRTGPADQRIGAAHPEEVVRAGAALDHVVARAGVELIVAPGAVQQVRPVGGGGARRQPEHLPVEVQDVEPPLGVLAEGNGAVQGAAGVEGELAGALDNRRRAAAAPRASDQTRPDTKSANR